MKLAVSSPERNGERPAFTDLAMVAEFVICLYTADLGAPHNENIATV